MRQMTSENIRKNQVETIEQYKVLQYLKQNLNIDFFQVFLQDRNIIKVIDRENQVGYFSYDEEKKEVKFYELKESEEELTF